MKHLPKIIVFMILAGVVAIIVNRNIEEQKKAEKERVEQEKIQFEHKRALDDEAAFKKSIDVEEVRNPAYPRFSLVKTQVRVLKVDASGPAASCYGLQKGDLFEGTEADLSRHYTHGESIEVLRDGSRLTLPAPGTAPKFPKPPPAEDTEPFQHVPITN